MVGAQVWAEVAWSVKTAQKQLNFYIENCQFSIAEENGGEIKADFIKDNCYSSTLGVRKIGRDFMVAQNSRFLFQAMSSSASTAVGAWKIYYWLIIKHYYHGVGRDSNTSRTLTWGLKL